MKILVTGFEPFDNESINPSWEAVKRLPTKIEQAEIISLQLPTVFQKSAQILFDAIALHKPNVVICVGQAGGRQAITPERVAINVDDARIPDNIGQQPIDHVIIENGPSAYFTTLPIKAMVENIQLKKISAQVSNSAGTFVCNHLMYQLLHHIRYENIRGGFIHIPYIHEQVIHKPGVFSMSLEDVMIGLTAAIEAIIQNNDDKKIIGGTLH